MGKSKTYGVAKRRFAAKYRHDLRETCRDCGASFVLTAGEQDYFAEHNLRLPVRCEKCRQARRAYTVAAMLVTSPAPTPTPAPMTASKGLAELTKIGQSMLHTVQAIVRDVDAIIYPAPAQPSAPTQTDSPAAPQRIIVCVACQQTVTIPARCKKQRKAKCQKCWQRDIDAWRKRVDRRRN